MMYERIRALREEKGLTQQQVGQAINTPKRTYAHYETGQRKVPLRILWALADFYDVSIDYLVGLTDTQKPHSQKY